MTYDQFISVIENFPNYAKDITPQTYFGFPLQPILDAEKKLAEEGHKSVAYFSMEYGLAPSIYNSFQLSRPMSVKNQFFSHEVFSNYWLSDYVFKININKMLDIPIYSGGLGVLAGDSVKSMADLGVTVVAFGILSFILNHVPPVFALPHLDNTLLERFVLDHNQDLANSIKFLDTKDQGLGQIRVYDLNLALGSMKKYLSAAK